MTCLEITTAVVRLDDGSRLPMRTEGDKAVIKALPGREDRDAITALLEKIGFSDVVWRPRNGPGLLRQSAPRPELPRSIDVVIETQEIVFRAGGSYPLSEMEFALMYNLFKGNGKLVNDDKLINGMYGWKNQPQEPDNNMKVIMNRCRKKLGGHARIENVYGRGYRLITSEHPDY